MKLSHIVISMLICASCNSEDETCSDGIRNQDEVQVDCGGVCKSCAIDYPETGAYGANALFGSDTLSITGEFCSLRANIPEGSSLKIELNLLSGDAWFFSQEQNWATSSFTNNAQTFTALSSGIADLELVDINTSNADTILIRYFENGSAETKQRIFIRE